MTGRGRNVSKQTRRWSIKATIACLLLSFSSLRQLLIWKSPRLHRGVRLEAVPLPLDDP